MATNRDLLKEAIADAKAVKETAIANAKAALEEAFAPQVHAMFSMKLQEMENEEELDGAGFGGMDPQGHGNIEDESSLYEEEDETMNEIDLEELLAELEEEETAEGLYEAEEEEEESEEEEEESEEGEEESEEGEEEGDPLDLEDMTDEDLKDMIEDVIKDMIASGELEAGEEGEEEVGMEDEEEVDLAELLKEIEEMEEMEEPIDELFGIKPGAVRRLEKQFPEVASKLMGAKSDEEKVNIFNTELRAEGPFKKSFGSNVQSYRADLGALEDFFKIKSTFTPSLGPDSAAGALGQANEAMKDELDEAMKTIEALKSELNEINLLNAKLLYTNKIFKSKNLNESQKVKVLSSFDKATTVGEVKMVFETLNEGIKVKKETIKENLGRASKATLTPSVKKPIVESNDAFLRMQKLAGII